MKITKSNLFAFKQDQLITVTKALDHPARIAILQQLLQTNSCINSDLVKELGLTQATISQHLKELKQLDIIQGTIEETRMSYCINPSTWLTLKTTFNTLFNQHPCC